MNDKKEPFFKRALDFIGDRGFYMVLFLCVAVIGVTAWVLSRSLNKTSVVQDDTLSTKITSAPLPSNDDMDIQLNPRSDNSQLSPYAVNPEASAGAADGNTAYPAAGDSNEDFGAAIDEAMTYTESTDDMPEAAETVAEAVATDFMWPVSGSVANQYSVEALAYDKTMADWRTHPGIDIGASLGEKVMAAANGSVEAIYDDEMLGTTVVINHGGNLKSVYSNLAKTPAVKAGDYVKMGDVIGSVGETALAQIGDVTHLYFRMTYDGKNINPNNYLPG